MRLRVLTLWAVMAGCASDAPFEEGTERPPEAVPPAQEEAVDAPGDFYIACGCGCCGGLEPKEDRCLGPGETLRSIIAQDKEQAASPQCPWAGCSFPVKHVVCEAAPPAP
jgi:hypothetical protein